MNPVVYIDPELQAYIDPLLPAELEGLEASLLAEGCRDPLVVWDGWLLDGHNRYALCTKHGLPFTTVEKTGLATKEDAMLWMIDNQLGKRNMTDFARVALALKRKPLLEAQARSRMLAGKPDPRANSPEGSSTTRDAIAKAAGVGSNTVSKVEKIIEKASADVIEQVRTGELSINAAAKTVTPPKPPKVAAEDVKPEIATPRLTPEQGAVAVTDVEALAAENAALREELDDLKDAMVALLADNEMMARVFEADDQVKASMAEVARYRAVAEQADRELVARAHEYNERARLVLYWKKRAEKAEKQLGVVGDAA
jgi:hypothetical protein